MLEKNNHHKTKLMPQKAESLTAIAHGNAVGNETKKIKNALKGQNKNEDKLWRNRYQNWMSISRRICKIFVRIQCL